MIIFELMHGDGSLAYTLVGHKNNISSVAISNDSCYVVTGSWDCTAIVWNLTIYDELKKLTPQQMALLEWLRELDGNHKKADFSKENPHPLIVHYIEQFALLPDHIKDMVKDFIVNLSAV